MGSQYYVLNLFLMWVRPWYRNKAESFIYSLAWFPIIVIPLSCYSCLKSCILDLWYKNTAKICEHGEIQGGSVMIIFNLLTYVLHCSMTMTWYLIDNDLQAVSRIGADFTGFPNPCRRERDTEIYFDKGLWTRIWNFYHISKFFYPKMVNFTFCHTIFIEKQKQTNKQTNKNQDTWHV